MQNNRAEEIKREDGMNICLRVDLWLHVKINALSNPAPTVEFPHLTLVKE